MCNKSLFFFLLVQLIGSPSERRAGSGLFYYKGVKITTEGQSGNPPKVLCVGDWVFLRVQPNSSTVIAELDLVFTNDKTKLPKVVLKLYYRPQDTPAKADRTYHEVSKTIIINLYLISPYLLFSVASFRISRSSPSQSHVLLFPSSYLLSPSGQPWNDVHGAFIISLYLSNPHTTHRICFTVISVSPFLLPYFHYSLVYCCEWLYLVMITCLIVTSQHRPSPACKPKIT